MLTEVLSPADTSGTSTAKAANTPDGSTLSVIESVITSATSLFTILSIDSPSFLNGLKVGRYIRPDGASSRSIFTSREMRVNLQGQQKYIKQNGNLTLLKKTVFPFCLINSPVLYESEMVKISSVYGNKKPYVILYHTPLPLA
ncbi:MAG: hypothetical protein ACI3U8_03655 [Candidatus Onthomonas sp.]